MDLKGRELRLDLRGEDVALLHRELVVLGFAIPDAERRDTAFGRGTEQVVARFQTASQLEPTGVVDAETARAINAAVDAVGFRVEGRVWSRGRAGVGRLRVEVVDKNVGEDVPLASAVTDERGAYRTRFTITSLRQRGKERPDLQARVFAGDAFLAASEVRYDASNRETLNVALPDRAGGALASEHETLTAALARHFQGALGDLREDDARQDLTYLANKTGWDARAVALGALADQFGARTRGAAGTPVIEPALFYALFRAGMPADEQALYQADLRSVATVWKQAIDEGVVPRTLEARVPEALERFRRLAAERALDGPALAGVSPLRELLSVSLGSADHRPFAELHVRHRDDPGEFWKAVRGAFGETVEKRLRLDGQLAYLTLNNAPLIGKLHAAAGPRGLADSAALVQGNYHRAATWRALLGADPIPPEIPGRDDAEKRGRYAEVLAAQVRLSFPTAVVAQMVGTGETPLAAPGLASQVQAFLAAHQGQFEIGTQPVGQFVTRHGVEVPAEVLREVARIQRVFQITLGDEAMNALLRRGLDSSRAVARYDREAFVRAFKDEVGGEATARLIHRKAQMVHDAVLNLAVSFLTASAAPGIGMHGSAQILDPSPTPPANATDVIAYPTLEGLFGEMDYCECEHCRSILSPAAYLVDLLLFLDPPETPPGTASPQAVLFERRPDLQHLPLTCENTNTPLPYIDLVNEALEYFVANNLSLADYRGHTTDGTARPEELLASPQFVHEAAYGALAGARFPPPLPFHWPLEALRRYFDRFEAPLSRVMEALRGHDGLERTAPSDYGWRDILMEELGFSRAEHELLTDGTLTLNALYGFPPEAAEADVLAALSSAKTLTRRLGITYEELVEILRTRFVNPHSTLIPRLERLGVPLATLQALRDGAISDAEFDARLAPGLDLSLYGGDVKAWVRNDANYARITSLIMLAGPAGAEDACRFDTLELRHADPDASASRLRAFEFVRLIRFVRLWKKLGRSIERTDKAITALYPVDQTPDGADDQVNLQRLDAGFLALLPRLGVVKRVIGTLGLTPEKDLVPLLACFAPMDTHGAASLYRQLFLSPALLKLDSAFQDDGSGEFLRGSARLLDHEEALRAAFQLTGAEFADIATALGYDASTPLTLPNVTAVFRRGWLARKLRMSVRELLLLARFAGLDPFAAPDPPAPPLLALVDLMERLRTASLKPAQALYLVWNQDVSGTAAPEERATTGLAREVRAALAAIEGEVALVDDPDGSIARARMALAYGSQATDLFFGFLDNTLATEVPYGHGQPTLPPSILAVAPGRLAYDDFRKRLSYAGVLTAATRDLLKAVPGVMPGFQVAVDDLFTENRLLVEPFFARYPELSPLHDAYVASGDPVETKRARLLAAFLPALTLRRKRQQALQLVSAAARSDLGLATVVLDDRAVLHAADDSTRPALDDLVALETAGLSTRFFFSDSSAGIPDLALEAEANLAYSAAGSHKLPPNGVDPGSPISAVWDGYLEAPENGFYNFRIEADPSATVALALDQAPVPLARDGAVWSNAAPIELRAGVLHGFALRVEKVKDTLAVRWETAGRGREVIPARHLYSVTLVDRLRRSHVRFLKAAALAGALQLTADETAYLGAHADHRIDGRGWLNSLSASGSPDAATAAALRRALDALLAFARVKAELAPGDERLLRVLEDPAAALQGPEPLLPALTRWDPASLTALLARFGRAVADLAHLETFRRVHDAQAWARKLGIPGAALLAVATNEPTAGTVRDLQAALRARYDEPGFLAVLRPINDALRGLQRDALVTHILHGMRSSPASQHIDTPDKLFEYFLMDVRMDACAQTSRVRHALSSVQLFIERCLMNLEPRVAPSLINARQWEWMRRYRVWEANRKVFLYPENWLEPELRDDQSPFFKEAMSELLQGDITEERATTALLTYLGKLDEVARLEPCGVHYVESEPDVAGDVVHVIGRTAGANRKYYYRRREYGYWTPWEPIKLDIEDTPVIPAVWRGRLFLFWLRLLKQGPSQAQKPGQPGQSITALTTDDIEVDARLTVQALLCWSEHFNGQWQAVRTSDVARPLGLGDFPATGAHAFDRSRLALSILPWTKGGLRVIVTNPNGFGASFFLHNVHSVPELRGLKKEQHFEAKRALDTATSDLIVAYPQSNVSHAVLRNAIQDRTVEPRHPLEGAPWDAPFFYEDRRHVFYVTTAERVVRIPRWDRFGLLPSLSRPAPGIPPLVLEPVEIVPVLAGPLLKQPGFGGFDPAPAERYVTEDAYIRRGLGTAGTVRFGDREIGPAGSQRLAPRIE
jgi:hypothetical protein